jgi:4-hydroxy-tetrahydrodipicolinate synthase
MQFDVQGVIPAMVTPFTRGGKNVDYDKACGVARHLAKRGVNGLFIAGTTGEGMLMTQEERKRLLEELVAVVGKRLKVIAHTGCLDTPGTIALTRHAREVGAAAAGVIAPGFYGYDETALLQHYKAVARSVKGFPVLLYNLPGCTRNLLTPELIINLATSVDNIVGIKDSGGQIQNLNVVLAKRPKDFRVINGTDEYSIQAISTGADGSVSSTANVVPNLFLAIYNNVKKGNQAAAWRAQKQLTEACRLFQYGRMVAYYKEGLRLQGVDAGFVRGPQRELTKAEGSGLARNLKKAGLI